MKTEDPLIALSRLSEEMANVVREICLSRDVIFKDHDVGDFRMFRVTTNRGTFEWAARGMFQIILVFEAQGIGHEVISITEVPR